MFEHPTAADLHATCRDPLRDVSWEDDLAASTTLYQICLFRPDVFHFGVKGREITRQVLFTSIVPKYELDKRPKSDIEYQYHPLQMYQTMLPKGTKSIIFKDNSVVNGVKSVTEKPVEKMFAEHWDTKQLKVLLVQEDNGDIKLN
jgi:hypothetical protein